MDGALPEEAMENLDAVDWERHLFCKDIYADDICSKENKTIEIVGEKSE